MNAEQAIQRLMEQIKREAESANLSKVTEVRLRLGCWENMDEKDLTAAFYRLKGDGLLGDARLVVDRKKPLARCRYCDSLFEVVYYKSRCKQCGSNYMEFIGDRGFELEGIDGIE
ncbi:MAG TPA: hydrogenase maturation nickel metallochaperone HypA [Bacillota bacterium]|jgi:Zn finger protein HypA/HybF involved in hydrogenase expression|nr:hydrogenase maturation nickel metallochaperone HypA [Bacillota bacterium]